MMQVFFNTDGTGLTAIITVIVDGDHIDPDSWPITNDPAIVLSSHPAATKTVTAIDTGVFKVVWSSLSPALAHGDVVFIAVDGELSTVAWTTWQIPVQCVHLPNTVTPATPTDVTDSESVITSTISTLNDFDPAVDVVAHVTLVDTTTANTDMRGTDGANTVTPATPTDVTAALVALDLDTALIAQGSERAVNVDVNHRVHANVYNIQANALDASALSADAVTEIQAGLARTGADGDTLETLSDQIDGLGGGGDATEANQIEILAALSGGAVTAYSPVNAAGDVTIIKGDDYLGTRLAVRIDDVGGTLLAYLQGASVTSVSLGAGIDSNVNQVVGTIDPDDGVYVDDVTTLYPQITSADITGPSSDNYVYHVKAVDSVLGEQTQATGNMIVLTERRQL